MQVEAPVTDSRFEVLSKLGEGGMGVVYAAYDRRLDARVALKTLRTLGPEALLRLKNEFRSLQDLHHENLVGLGELFEHQGTWFFTMELVDGVDLLRWVRGSASASPATMTPSGMHSGVATADLEASTLDLTDPGLSGHGAVSLPVGGAADFDEERLKSTLAQLARALMALHAAGKVHRDVKPSNVLVSGEGRVVVLDFGLIASTENQDREARLVGTAEYMAPEQAAREIVGPPADWYAVGVVLYQALTGRLPFQGRPIDILRAKQTIEPLPPGELVPDVSPALASLAMRLLERNPAARPDGRQVLEVLGAAPDDATAARSAPFVGRAREMAELRRAFDRSAGQATVVVVEGESGIGKTALVRYFLEGVEGRARVLHARCFERESVPYKAVDGAVDALSRALGAMSASETMALLPRNAPALGQVFPVLRRVPGLEHAAASAAEPREMRLRAFGALRELLARLADERPLVLAVDDFQWADRDSIELLGELLRAPGAPKLLFVITLRRVDEGARVPDDWAAVRIALEALPADDAASLAEALVGDGDAARDLARASGGHPLFIGELARRPEGVSRPFDLDEALRARIEALDAPSRRLAELVAVAALPLAREVAAATLGMPPTVVARHANRLRADRLARSGPAPGSLEAYHDRVRAALIGGMTAEARRELHRRLAETLELRGTGEAERLAVHWEGAGEPAKAAGWAEKAAEEAAAAVAFDRAARLYRMAIRLGSPAREDAARLWSGLGEALANAGRGAEAAEAFDEAAKASEPTTALDLRRRSAQQYLTAGRFDDGLAIVREILPQLGMRWAATPARALLSLLFARAWLRLRGFRFRERAESELSPIEKMRVDATYAISVTIGAADTIRGADFQTRNVLLSLGAGEPYRVARGMLLEASYSAVAGNAGRARAQSLLDLARPLAARIGNPHALAWSELSGAYVAFLCGQFREAVEKYDRAEPMFREKCRDVAYELDSIQLFRSWALYYTGELRRVFDMLPLQIADARQRSDLHSQTNLATRLAHTAALAANDPERASREAAEGVKAWSKEGFYAQHWYEMYAQTDVHLYRGEGSRALARVESQWKALSRSLLLEVQFIFVEALHLRGRAALAAALEQPARRASLHRWTRFDIWRIERQGLAWGAPLAGLLRAAIAAQQGDRRAAADLLERAAAAAEAADMHLYAHAARRRWGELLGDAGAEKVAAADAWMRERRIQDPARYAAMLVPGIG